MHWIHETSVLIVAVMVTVAPCAVRVDAQIIRPDPTTDSPPDQAHIARDGATVPGDRIERMLAQMSPDRDPQLRSLNLREYVIVVGQQPEVSLFGSEPDLTGGAPQYGAPSHAEMLAAATPADFRQAAGTDSLGIATAALSTLAPAAIDAIVGWFAGADDDTPRGPRYAGYTASFRLDDSAADPSARVSAVPFYRSEGQAVSLSATFDPELTGGVIMTVDDQPLGVFDREIRDLKVPDDLLMSARQGDVHLLKLTRQSDAIQRQPVEIDVVVVVRERDVAEP